MPKIVLQINSSVNRGSHGRIAEEIGKLAIKDGWSSYIVYGRNEGQSKSQTIKVGSNWDLKWHGLITRLFDRHGLASVKATKQLIAKIDKIAPDIIHLHNIHGYYLNYKLLFEYLQTVNVPIVWTLHDCWAFTGHCSYFTYVQCNKWKTECFRCPQKRGYPASFFTDRSKKNFLEKKKSFLSVADKLTLVPVSNWLANLCLQSFFKDTPIKKIYNGVDTDIFKPIFNTEKTKMFKKHKITGSFLIVGVANVWAPRKGLDDFIKLRSFLSEEYSILLVGLSKKQIQSLPQGIIGVTRTENATELMKIYASADVFLNPSVEETFGLTTIEALSSGTPAIVYNSSASPELITQDTGFAVEPQDFPSILNAIDQIKQKGKPHYSAACREHSLKFFKKEDSYEEYLQLYAKLIVKNND